MTAVLLAFFGGLVVGAAGAIAVDRERWSYVQAEHRHARDRRRQLLEIREAMIHGAPFPPEAVCDALIAACSPEDVAL